VYDKKNSLSFLHSIALRIQLTAISVEPIPVLQRDTQPVHPTVEITAFTLKTPDTFKSALQASYRVIL
jgi:hypothetical protein